MTRITEHTWKRRLPPELRRELFTYVPRGRAVGMEPERFEAVLRAYGREDLAERALRLMGLKDEVSGVISSLDPLPDEGSAKA